VGPGEDAAADVEYPEYPKRGGTAAMKLDGKVAIVTGGSRGIGKAIAKAFLDEGAKVAILARTKAEVEDTASELSRSGLVVGYTCDVSVERQVSEVSGRVFDELGPASVLVNCAGVVGAIGPLERTDSQAWWNTVEINLYGTYLWCKAVIHQMRQNRQGKIINISGGGAVPRPNFSAYTASKAGVIYLTESLSREMWEFNIQVNAIAPGPVNTRMTKQVVESGSAAGIEESKAALRLLTEDWPQPIKAADLAIFLASSDSDGITGKLISAVHDNWPAWPEHSDTLANTDLYTLRRLDPFTIGKLDLGSSLPL
jgi:NAD(P)-dependent dehydrogenase (short-subunit alcohol dehydrogenase family)